MPLIVTPSTASATMPGAWGITGAASRGSASHNTQTEPATRMTPLIRAPNSDRRPKP